LQILGLVEDVKNWLSQNQPLSHHKKKPTWQVKDLPKKHYSWIQPKHW
jgi:hypothetical protein